MTASVERNSGSESFASGLGSNPALTNGPATVRPAPGGPRARFVEFMKWIRTLAERVWTVLPGCSRCGTKQPKPMKAESVVVPEPPPAEPIATPDPPPDFQCGPLEQFLNALGPLGNPERQDEADLAFARLMSDGTGEQLAREVGLILGRPHRDTDADHELWSLSGDLRLRAGSLANVFRYSMDSLTLPQLAALHGMFVAAETFVTQPAPPGDGSGAATDPVRTPGLPQLLRQAAQGVLDRIAHEAATAAEGGADLYDSASSAVKAAIMSGCEKTLAEGLSALHYLIHLKQALKQAQREAGYSTMEPLIQALDALFTFILRKPQVRHVMKIRQKAADRAAAPGAGAADRGRSELMREFMRYEVTRIAQRLNKAGPHPTAQAHNKDVAYVTDFAKFIDALQIELVWPPCHGMDPPPTRTGQAPDPGFLCDGSDPDGFLTALRRLEAALGTLLSSAAPAPHPLLEELQGHAPSLQRKIGDAIDARRHRAPSN